LGRFSRLIARRRWLALAAAALLPLPGRAVQSEFSRRAMQLRDEAARKLATRDLSGCDLYGSSRACRMCEAAAYWAGISRLFHGEDAAGGRPPQL